MKVRCSALLKLFLAVLVFLPFLGDTVLAQTEKPNILVIWGDDVGRSNISAYTKGVMGYAGRGL